MNDTNNVSDNNINNNTPVQNSVPVANTGSVQSNETVAQSVTQPVDSQPQVQSVQPVQSTSDSQQSSTVTSSDTLDNKKTDANTAVKDDTVLSKSQEEVKNAKLRFPVIVSILVTVFIIIFIIYYFFLTNPSKAYNKILKISIDKITGLVDFTNSKDRFVNTDAKIVIDTNSVDFESKENLAYIDGLTYNIGFNRDNEKNNFHFTLKDNMNDLDGSSNFTFSKSALFDMYYVGSNIYAKPQNDFIAVRSNLFSKEDDSIYSFIKEYFYEVIDNLNLDKVERKFSTKKVNDQTLLAIKYELNYDANDVQKLSEVTTNNILDASKHPDFVKKLSNFTDMDENTIKMLLKSFQDLTKNTDSVKFNYYMNISFSSIICMEMITDSGVFSISYLNDYYFINYNSKDDSVKFNFAINFNTFDLSGDAIIDTKDGYSKLIISTDYEINDETYKLDNNVITVKVYDKDKEKPYMSIVTELKHDYTEKIINGDSIKSIDRENATSEEIEILEYTSKKITYELSYLLVLLTKNKMNVDIKDILNSMNNDLNGENGVQPDDNVDVPVVNEKLDNSGNVITPSE